jgi:hypothetical protein
MVRDFENSGVKSLRNLPSFNKSVDENNIKPSNENNIGENPYSNVDSKRPDTARRSRRKKKIKENSDKEGRFPCFLH